MILSVIMPIKAWDEYTGAAVESTLTAIHDLTAELILIVSDAGTRDFILKQHRECTQLVIITSAVNNIIFKLNLGLQNSGGQFIARMDADDICAPERFKLQLKFMEENDCDFGFSAANLIDENSDFIGETFSNASDLFVNCSLIHPTMIAKRKTLLDLGGYGNIIYSEDYHLWLSANLNGKKISSQAAKLISYRVHSQQLSGGNNIVKLLLSNFALKILLGLQYNRKILIFYSLSDFTRAILLFLRSKFGK
jgi:O86/O127-antigen biosynthesis beta-1,3-galactosyltransferase